MYQGPSPPQQHPAYPNPYPPNYFAQPPAQLQQNQLLQRQRLQQQQYLHTQQYGNGTTPSMPPPSTFAQRPVDLNAPAHTPPFNPQYHSQPPPNSTPTHTPNAASSTAVSPFSPTQQGQKTPGQLAPSVSSMNAFAPPNASAQSTPTSEAPSHPTTPQTSRLSPQDQGRVAALLHLNSVLLKEVSALQQAGAAQPAQSPTQPSSAQPNAIPEAKPASTPTEPSKATPTTMTPTSTTTPIGGAPPNKALPTKKQMSENYMRRLQANIAYLLGMSQGKTVPAFPAAMEPPPESWINSNDEGLGESEARIEAMRDAYKKLKELWPDYRPGMRSQPVGQGQGPGQSQAQAPVQTPGQPAQS